MGKKVTSTCRESLQCFLFWPFPCLKLTIFFLIFLPWYTFSCLVLKAAGGREIRPFFFIYIYIFLLYYIYMLLINMHIYQLHIMNYYILTFFDVYLTPKVNLFYLPPQSFESPLFFGARGERDWNRCEVKLFDDFNWCSVVFSMFHPGMFQQLLDTFQTHAFNECCSLAMEESLGNGWQALWARNVLSMSYCIISCCDLQQKH